MPKPTSKLSARRAATRERLLASTLAVLAKRGLHGLSLDAVAADAGVTKGAIYDNFESKDALLIAALATQLRDETDVFVWPTDRSGTTRERLRRLGQAVIDGYRAAPQAAVGNAEFLLYVLTHEDFRARLMDIPNRGPRRAVPNIEALFAPGELGMSAEAFSIMLNSMIPGLMFARQLAAAPIPDAVVLAIFEGLAGPA